MNGYVSLENGARKSKISVVAGETYYLVARPLSEGNYGSYTVYARNN